MSSSHSWNSHSAYLKSWFTSGTSCRDRISSRPSVLAIKHWEWIPSCCRESCHQIRSWSSDCTARRVIYFESRRTGWPSRSYWFVSDLKLYINLVFDFLRIGSGKSTLAMSIFRFVGWFDSCRSLSKLFIGWSGQRSNHNWRDWYIYYWDTWLALSIGMFSFVINGFSPSSSSSIHKTFIPQVSNFVSRIDLWLTKK